MKLFVKLMVLVLIAALAGPFFIRGPDGEPLARWGDVQEWFADAGRDVRSGFSAVTEKAARLAGDENAGKTPVYRWRDAQGAWHFSDEAPAGVTSELIHIDGDANLVDAPTVRRPASSPTPPSPLTVSPAKARDLVGDAYAARKALEERPLPD